MANEHKKKFVDMLLPAAVEVSRRTGVDPRIIIAQAALESDWGRRAPGHNYFGIKSHGKKGGQKLTTHEVIGGRRVKTQDSFRTYSSPLESVLGYGEFITQNPRYKPFREARGIDAQLAALQASGYATDPNYSKKLSAIIRNLPIGQPPKVTDSDFDPARDLRGSIDAPVAQPSPPPASAAPTVVVQRPEPPAIPAGYRPNVTPPPPGPVMALLPTTFIGENALRPAITARMNSLAMV